MRLNLPLGTAMVIDELSLPEAQRQAKSVRLTDIVADEEPLETESNDDVYLFEGLVFRVVALATSAKDLESNYSDVYMRYVCATDLITHKMIGNESRAYFAIRNALFAMESSAEHSKSAVRPTVVLQTLVDYGGYRVQVFCPVHIDERRTLVYGSTAADGIFVHADDGDTSSDTDPPYTGFCRRLADGLNVEPSCIDVISCQSSAQAYNLAGVDSEYHRTKEVVLSRDCQIHRSTDGRHYLINLNGFFPPDCPRPDSNDVLTNCLRPEYVKSYETPLCSSAVSAEDENGTQPATNGAGMPEDNPQVPQDSDNFQKQSSEPDFGLTKKVC
jgi:hypothetical protein